MEQRPEIATVTTVSDWLAKGGSAEALRELIANAPQFTAVRPSPLAFRRHRDANNRTRKDVVKGLLPETGTGLLSGQSGTYKTFVALNLAGAIATGKPLKADTLRNEFYKQYPASDADDKQEAKRKAYVRAVKAAQDKGLIAVREVTGTQFIWLGAKTNT